MNRVALAVVIVALFLYVAVGELDARTINLRQSLHLAAGDTISAQTVMDSIRVATREDILVCDSLVIRESIDLDGPGADTVWCALDFRETTFQGRTFLWGVNFQGSADLRRATFQGDVYFDGSAFQERTSFWAAAFKGSPSFLETTFHKWVSFVRAMFNKGAYFGRVTFQWDANFEEAVFKAKADFSQTTFRGDVIFRATTFQKAVGFPGAAFEGRAYFGSVYTSGPIFVEWPQLDGHIAYSRPNYFFLLRNFEQLGYTDDYDDCYYDFRVQARKHERRLYSPIRGLECIFLDLTCGYGVKPFRAIIWAAAVIVLFAWFYYQFGAIQERRLEAHTHEGPRGYTLLGPTDDPRTRWVRFRDALYFSVNTFTTVGYGGWYPTAERLKVRLWKCTLTIPVLRFRTLAMMEGLIGWLLLALFLVTLGKKWIR